MTQSLARRSAELQARQAVIQIRHPEARAKRASKGDGPGRSSFEGLASLGHLRMTVIGWFPLPRTKHPLCAHLEPRFLPHRAPVLPLERRDERERGATR